MAKERSHQQDTGKALRWYEQCALQELELDLRDTELRNSLRDVLDSFQKVIPISSEAFEYIDSAKGRTAQQGVSELLRQLTLLERKQLAEGEAFRRFLSALRSAKLGDIADKIQLKAEEICAAGEKQAQFAEKARAKLAGWNWGTFHVSRLNTCVDDTASSCRDVAVCLEIYRQSLLEVCGVEQVMTTMAGSDDSKKASEIFEPIRAQKLTRPEAKSLINPRGSRSPATSCGEPLLVQEPFQLLLANPLSYQTAGSGPGLQAVKSCLVLSGAGTGKTTVCRRILAMYAASEATPLTKQRPYPVYIHCEDTDRLQSQGWLSVLGLTEEQCRDLSEDERVLVREYLFAHSDQVLLVLDGVDEVPSPSLLPEPSKECALHQLLDRRSRGPMSSATLLAAGRICSQAAMLVSACDVIYSLAGFASLEAYLCKRLKSDQGQECFRSLNDTVREAIKATPLFAHILTEHYPKERQKAIPQNITLLYKHYLGFCVRDYEEKCSKQLSVDPGLSKLLATDVPSLSSLLEDDAEGSTSIQCTETGQLFAELQSLAYKMVCQPHGTNDLNVTDLAVTLGKGIGVLRGSSTRKKPVFGHVTWREYLASRELVGKKNLMSEVGRCVAHASVNEQTWLPFWQFVCGAVDTSYLADIICILYEEGMNSSINKKRLLCFLMQCIQENHLMQQGRGEWSVSKKIETVLCKKEMNLSQCRMRQVNASALGVCLSFQKFEKLILKSCGIVLPHIQALLSGSSSTCLPSQVGHLDLSGNRLTGKPLEYLASSLCCAKPCHLSTLNLAHCDLGAADAEPIAQLMQLRSLSDFMLSGLDPRALPLISSKVPSCGNLARLAFDDCNFSAGSGDHLRSLLHNTPKLKDLFLRDNKLTSHDLAVVFPILANMSSLRCIWLQQNLIDDDILPGLIKFIEKCEGRQHVQVRKGAAPIICIGLECNKVTRSCLDAILKHGLGGSSEILTGEFFIHLGGVHRINAAAEIKQNPDSLCQRGINDAMCESIFQSVANCFKEKVLDLKVNQIGDEGIRMLVPYLPDLTSVEVLDLAFNNIGPAGSCQLLSALNNQVQPSIRSVALGNNPLFSRRNLSQSPMVSFANLLKTQCNISCLLLNKTGMTEEDGEKLAAALEWNSSLVMLSVAHNQLGDAFATALVRALDRALSRAEDMNATPTLRRISLGRNRITEKGVKTLMASAGMQRLECVWMQGNPCPPEHFQHPLLDAAFAFVSKDLVEASYEDAES